MVYLTKLLWSTGCCLNECASMAIQEVCSIRMNVYPSAHLRVSKSLLARMSVNQLASRCGASSSLRVAIGYRQSSGDAMTSNNKDAETDPQKCVSSDKYISKATALDHQSRSPSVGKTPASEWVGAFRHAGSAKTIRSIVTEWRK
jgi:hypothetical protein